jgi:hypothetical protein
MAEDLTLPIPGLLAAPYLVPASMPAEAAQARAREALPARLDGSLAALVLGTLDLPGLVTFSARAAGDLRPLPVTMQRYLGASPEQIQAMVTAAEFIEVTGLYRPGWPPVQQWAARAAAAALAADLGVPVLDAFVPRVLGPDKALAALPDGGLNTRLSDWVLALHSKGPLGLWFTSRGLGRFGLPELQARNVPPHLAQPFTFAFTALASRLLDLWLHALAGAGKAAFAQVPVVIDVAEADVARAYRPSPRGRRQAASEPGASGGGRVRVRLAFDPAVDDRADSFLTVMAPDDWPSSAGEHLAAVCAELLGAPGRDVRAVRRDEAMERAMRTARDSLAAARARFLSGDLAADALLMVKHKVPSAEGTEYVWAYVTSWADPSRVLASSASDADLDPGIRVGRPIVIDADAVVDWAIWIDGPGIVEGGWTNQAVLDNQDG